jgi:hypothetical protein
MKKMSKQLLTALFVLVGLQANEALVKMGLVGIGLARRRQS